MTTIAFRDGVLAADTLVTDQGLKYRKTVKVWRGEDVHGKQILVAACGDSALCAMFLVWAKGKGVGDSFAPRPVLKEGDRAAIGYVFRKESFGAIKAAYLVTEHDGALPPVTYEVKQYFAAGSGREFALGAMYCGANAAAAVDAGIAHDVFSGGGIEAVGFEDEPPKAKAKKK